MNGMQISEPERGSTVTSVSDSIKEFWEIAIGAWNLSLNREPNYR